jgi:hypothetical protein
MPGYMVRFWERHPEVGDIYEVDSVQVLQYTITNSKESAGPKGYEFSVTLNVETFKSRPETWNKIYEVYRERSSTPPSGGRWTISRRI